MIRGNTEAETLDLNGWTVGDILECEYVHIRIVWVDKFGIWGLRKHKNIDGWSSLSPLSLAWGEWRKVGRVNP